MQGIDDGFCDVGVTLFERLEDAHQDRLRFGTIIATVAVYQKRGQIAGFLASGGGSRCAVSSLCGRNCGCCESLRHTQTAAVCCCRVA